MGELCKIKIKQPESIYFENATYIFKMLHTGYSKNEAMTLLLSRSI